MDDNLTGIDNSIEGFDEPVQQQDFQPLEQENNLDFGDQVADVGLGAARGFIGFGQSLYDLADFVTADILPDIDLNQKVGLGKTKTFAGGLTEGITQFLTGFIPVAGGLGKLAQVGKGAGQLNKFGKFVAISKNINGKSKVALNWKGDLVAGSIADYVSFDAQEERLSNLVEANPELSNPITQFLAASDDDNELLGRAKNSIEGVLTELGVGVVLKHGLLKSLDTLRDVRKEVKLNDGSVDPVAKVEQTSIDTTDLGETGKAEYKSKLYEDDGATFDEDLVKTGDEVKPKDDADLIDENAIKAESENEVKTVKNEVEPEEVLEKIKANESKYSEAVEAGEILATGKLDNLTTQKSDVRPSMIAGSPAGLEGLMQGVHNVLNTESIKKATLSVKDVELRAGTMIDEIVDDMDQLGIDIGEAVTRKLDTPITLDDAGSFTLAIRTFQDMVNTEVMDVVEKAKKLPKRDTEQAQEIVETLKALLYQNANLEAKNSEFIASKLGTGLQKQHKERAMSSFKKVNLEGDEIIDRSKRTEFLEQTKGMDESDLWNLVDLIDKAGDTILRDPTVLPKLLKPDILTRSKDWLYKYWINSLLSGPKTHVANLASATLHSSMRSLYMTVGAGLDGNKELANGILNTVINKQNDASMALRLADMFEKGKDTFKTGVSDFEGASAKTFQDSNISEDSASSFLDKLISAPTRALLGEDAFMKQVEFKKTIERNAYADALNNKGLTDPDEIASYVERVKKSVYTEQGRLNNPYNAKKEAEKALRDSGEWDNMTTADKMNAKFEAEAQAKQRLGEFGNLQELALEDANKTLFLNKAEGETGKLQEWLANAPFGLRWIIPFTKTPINVISSGMSLAFAPAKGVASLGARAIPENGALKGLRDKIMDGYNSPDPVIRAETKGKLAVSSALWATTVTAINSNAVTITGGGSTDPAQRKRMEDTGWQKYSLKIGDKFYSFQRLDPVAMLLGLAADVRDHTNDPSREIDGLHDSYAAVAMTAIHNNVLDKSFLVGLDSFLNALNSEAKMQKWLQNSAASFVPSIIPHANEIATGSPVTAEAWGFTDAIQRRLILGSGGLDPKRNILGEEVDNQELSGVTDRLFDIVANVSESKSDVVLDEIAALRQGFDIPSKVIAGGIDLTEFEQANGRSAYDYFRKAHGDVKVGGKTLRQALSKTIKSNWYQNIDSRSYPDFKSQRINELQKVIRRYRSRALQETLNEFPQIKRAYDTAADIRSSQKRGVDVYSQVENLINLTN